MLDHTVDLEQKVEDKDVRGLQRGVPEENSNKVKVHEITQEKNFAIQVREHLDEVCIGLNIAKPRAENAPGPRSSIRPFIQRANPLAIMALTTPQATPQTPKTTPQI